MLAPEVSEEVGGLLRLCLRFFLVAKVTFLRLDFFFFFFLLGGVDSDVSEELEDELLLLLLLLGEGDELDDSESLEEDDELGSDDGELGILRLDFLGGLREGEVSDDVANLRGF